MSKKIMLGNFEQDIDKLLSYEPEVFLNYLMHAIDHKVREANQKLAVLLHYPEPKLSAISLEHLAIIKGVEQITVGDWLTSVIDDLHNIYAWGQLAQAYSQKLYKDKQSDSEYHPD